MRIRMRSLLKWLSALAVLAALGQGLLWYAASRWFAQAAETLSPIAELTYASSFAWPNGRAGIRDVRLQPRMASGEAIGADSVSFRTGGPIQMLSLLFNEVDEPPENIDLRIERLRLGADTERTLREHASRLGYLAPFEALGCNDQGRFTGSDYAELGWLQALADIEFSLRRDSGGGALALDLAYDMTPLGRFDLNVELAGVPSDFAAMAAAGAGVQVERARARFQDRGMLAQRNAYCARKQGADPMAFLNHHLQAVSVELESGGVFLDEAVLAVYRDFVERGGSLELAVAPSSTISLGDYGHYKPEDRLRLLNASLRHDDNTLVPVTARFFAAGTGADTTRPDATEAVSVRAEATDADQLLFEELPGLAGQRIRVATSQGIAYVGTLLSVEGPLLRIEVERRSGPPQRVVLSRQSILDMQLVE